MKRALLGLSIVAALLYLAGIGGPAQIVCKGVTVTSLAIIAFYARQPLLGVALAFGSLGDVLLDLDPARLFIFGLVAFLAGHLTYIALFVRHRRRPMRWTPARIATAFALIAFTLAFSAWLTPHLGALAVPVYAYMGAILCMALSTVAAGFARPWIVIGAIFFVASDSMLGAAKFAGPFPGRDILVWTTYCLAQYGLCFGYLTDPMISGDA